MRPVKGMVVCVCVCAWGGGGVGGGRGLWVHLVALSEYITRERQLFRLSACLLAHLAPFIKGSALNGKEMFQL